MKQYQSYNIIFSQSELIKHDLLVRVKHDYTWDKDKQETKVKESVEIHLQSPTITALAEHLVKQGFCANAAYRDEIDDVEVYYTLDYNDDPVDMKDVDNPDALSNMTEYLGRKFGAILKNGIIDDKVENDEETYIVFPIMHYEDSDGRVSHYTGEWWLKQLLETKPSLTYVLEVEEDTDITTCPLYQLSDERSAKS